MTELEVDREKLTADLFHMLINELHTVQDEVKAMRSDLGRILLPRIEDVTAANVETLKDRLTEQDLVRSLASRVTIDHAHLRGKLPLAYVDTLKKNGFRVCQTQPVRALDDPLTFILWGGSELNDQVLRFHWNRPEEFIDL